MIPPSYKNERVLICILLDGLGYDIVEKLSFLSNLFDDVRPLKTVLGYSCAAQPSILTGRMPTGHGGLCVYYRSDESIFSWMKTPSLVQDDHRGKPSKDIVDHTRRLHGITGHFNIWEIPRHILPEFQLYERNSFYLKNPIIGVPTILDEAQANNKSISAYYWNTPEDQIFSETEQKLISQEADFHFLYISKTDHLLHLKIDDPTAVEDELKMYADRIKHLHKIAKENYRDVQLMVFSDHGMLKVTGRIDVMGPVSKLPYTMGKDYLAFYDATMVRFWFDNPECRQPIVDAMAEIEGIRLLSDDELKNLGGLFHDRRYGEELYLTDRGKTVSPNYFGAQEGIVGMHGYHPGETGYEAFLGVSNVDISDPKTITDLHGIMRRNLLGKVQRV